MRVKMGVLVPLSVIALAGCAHYHAQPVRELAVRNGQASALSEQMCRDFQSAAENLSAGPDTACPLIGKAGEIKELSTTLQKKSLQCGEVVSRCHTANEALSSCNLANQALGSFKGSWDDALKIVGGK